MRKTTAAGLLAAAALALTGCHDGSNPFAPAVDSTASPASATVESVAPAVPTGAPDPDRPHASDVLATLEVKGRAPLTGYTREQFGPRWSDVDRNGCDTRNDVLKRDLDGETFEPDTHDCIVTGGTLDDPYTATRIQFQRGQDTSNAVQIDHVVALANAWQTGAQQITADERKMLSNDPLNLQATSGPINAQKKDGDAATWLPPARGYRCTYVAQIIAVKAKYRLWVTPAERDAMNVVLTSCPEQQVPSG